MVYVSNINTNLNYQDQINYNNAEYIDNLTIIYYDLNRFLNGLTINQKADNYLELKNIINDQLNRLFHVSDNDLGIINIDENYISLILDGNEEDNFERRIFIYNKNGSQFYTLYNNKDDRSNQFITRYDIKNKDIIKTKINSEGLLILTMKGNSVYNSNHLVKIIERKSRCI